MKINVLGTEYEIIENAKRKDYQQLDELDGFTDFSIKKIIIAEQEKDNDIVKDLEYITKKVTRHEIVHAFMYESGLDCNSDYARNEELIDWIAIQFEKMLEVFENLNIISYSKEIKENKNKKVLSFSKTRESKNKEFADAISKAINDEVKKLKDGIIIGPSTPVNYGDGFNDK